MIEEVKTVAKRAAGEEQRVEEEQKNEEVQKEEKEEDQKAETEEPVLNETEEQKMPPRVRGRGRGDNAPIFTSHDHEAGPSHRRTLSVTMSTSPQEDWRTYLEPARRSVSLSSSLWYHHSFRPQSENEPNDSRHSFLPLQRSSSHRAFEDPAPYFQSRFNPVNQVQEPVGFNPSRPEDHFSDDHAMDMDDDPDSEMPPSGTPTHPIEISDGSSLSRFTIPRPRQL
ncbi:nuclear cap-binding protein subunit 3-like [Helianthus annuus]|uniref:nuclear cap-binding protein subunit 3-like n=1 Tax=Helianthus annuus TaxID=4232 RepID=UPI000B8F76C9|nr:nuclear cap-binding protein subunit 3-like [Helianthus annuus]